MNLFQTGQQLRVARAVSGLTQNQLAQLTGVHSNTVSRYEKDGPIPPNLAIQKLTEYLCEAHSAIDMGRDGILQVTL